MSEKPSLEPEEAPRGPSRRTIVAAAAWSVPVIAVASAAPAMAASPGVITFDPGQACKHPGQSQQPFNQDYHFVIRVKNTTGSDVTVTITQMLIDGQPVNFSVGAGVLPSNMAPKTFVVPASAGAAGQEFIIHGDGTNSANTSVQITYTYAGVEGQQTGVASVSPCIVTT